MARAPVDDRGKPCDVARLSRPQLWWRALGFGSFTPDAKHARREQKHTEVYDAIVVISGGIIALIVWRLLVMPAFGVTGFVWNIVGYTAFVPVVATIAWVTVLPEIRRRRFKKIAAIYLQTGRCAACGYALADLDPEPDGCVVCPECNAAWRADRLTADDTPQHDNDHPGST